MTLQYRQYADADFGRVQAALAGWIRFAGDCGYYHPGNLAHWIYAILRGRRPIGELVALWEDGHGIAGVAIQFLFGTAFHAFVRPSLRGSDGELAILASAHATTRQMMDAAGNQSSPVVTDVVSCDAPRMALLERLGFRRYRVWDHVLERSLAEPITAPVVPAGFQIRHATLANAAQLAAARNDAFADDWTGRQYLDEVMRKPGYNPERELIVVAPGGQIATFTVIWLDAVNQTGLFEPVGTVRAFQRRGLARALMLFALRAMRRDGMTAAVVEHDAMNMAAAALYQSVGFQKKYETWGYAL